MWMVMIKIEIDCNSDDVDIGWTKYCKGAPSRRQLESEISVPEFSGRKNLTPPSKHHRVAAPNPSTKHPQWW